MAEQLVPAALLMIATVLGGAVLTVLVERVTDLNTPLRAGLVPLLGVSGIGVVTLAVGTVGGLGPWLPSALVAVSAAAALFMRPSVLALARDVLAGTARQWREHVVQVSAVALAFAVAVVASFAPPFRIDEVEYHWAAPVAWAEAGRWNDSPYRHVDGFPFMEVIYTSAATMGSYAAAHLLHLVTLLGLGLAAAGAGRALGLKGTGAVAAGVMVMPVAWDGSYVAYNDTAPGALGVAAAAAVLISTRRANVILATGLVMVGISIKPTAAGAAGVIGLIILMRVFEEVPRPARLVWVLRRWAVVAMGTVAALAFWTVRRFLYTQTWLDPDLTSAPSADELTRLPSTLDQVVAPLMPLVLGVVGAEEPWGGRTSLVLQAFIVPALIYVVWHRGDVARRFSLVMVPAWAHWVVVGLVGVRTRFHVVSWALMVVAMRVAVEDVARRSPRWRVWLEAAWAGLVLVGVLDVSMEMVRLIRDTWWVS